jgi:hypothetical protein
VSVDPDVIATGQPYAYAGDNPVNEVDPMGLCNSGVADGYYPGACATTAAESIAAGEYIQSHVSGGGWSLTQAVHSEADYLAGVANGVVSTVTFGQVNVSEPYCNALSWAYGTGTGFGFAVTAVAASAGAEALAELGPFNEVGAVGGGSPALDPANADMTVQEYASKFMNGTNARRIPGEFLNMSVKDALETGNTTVRKLLTNLRFQKG